MSAFNIGCNNMIMIEDSCTEKSNVTYYAFCTFLSLLILWCYGCFIHYINIHDWIWAYYYVLFSINLIHLDYFIKENLNENHNSRVSITN